VSESCFFCPATATEAHHITGRPWGGAPYLDPELTVPSCSSCNKQIDHVWRVFGISRVDSPLAARLLRLAFFFAQVADGHWSRPLPPPFWLALAACMADIAAEFGGRR
jgi:hypothetical protein